jgi:SAM-dependent methyltransferase
MMKFKESAHAHQWLDGLTGLEIGGAAHNPFGLPTRNVDRLPHTHPDFAPYANEQMRLCGEVMPVDIVAPGDHIPLQAKCVDFVVSSHVIEHFYDPIAALKEWVRLSRQYVYIICPHRDALPSDVHKPLTTLDEHIARHTGQHLPIPTDEHHSRWTPDSFIMMCDHFGFHVLDVLYRDDKVGNGFTILIDVQRTEANWKEQEQGRGASNLK